MFTREGHARWAGGLKEGKGVVSTQSSALKDQPYGFATRFEDKPGTNPEELIGAAHAACFSMALSKMLEEAGISGVVIDSKSAVSLEKDGEGFSIKKVHLTTTIEAEGDQARIEELAHKAKDGCPVSKLLRADITFQVTIK